MLNYKYITLNDSYELNVWLDFVLRDLKKEEKYSKFRFIIKKLSIKNSRTTFQEIESVRKELMGLSELDLKHLRMIIENRETTGIGLEFKAFLQKIFNYFGVIVVGLIPVILGYNSIERVVTSWLNAKTFKSSILLIVWIFVLYIYYVGFQEFFLHDSKKREVRKYLLFLINDIFLDMEKH
ncbi:TPA: hypothetical protein ACUBWQ_000830 [Streptococcus agalactiae]|uniref:hypothetical protein n=1 Tax=Streptococcus agalactiae TaxID=1311 RepID=UPI001CCFCE3A|nr:hypothetical protein [Streptococcus agalactiae]